MRHLYGYRFRFVPQFKPNDKKRIARLVIYGGPGRLLTVRVSGIVSKENKWRCIPFTLDLISESR